MMLQLARLDWNQDGQIDAEELKAFTVKANKIISDFLNFMNTWTIVSALVVAASHTNNIGRPSPWVAAPEFESIYGAGVKEALLWAAYTTNMLLECLALTVLVHSSLYVTTCPYLPCAH